MKTLNEYITEDNLWEACTIIEEVLSYEYTDEEIEESFDAFNLILEANKFNKDMKKSIKVFLKKHKDLVGEINSVCDEYDKKLENIKQQYKDTAKFDGETGEQTKEGKKYFKGIETLEKNRKNKLLNAIKEKTDVFDSGTILDFLFYYLANIKKSITKLCKDSKNDLDKFISDNKIEGNKEQLKNIYGSLNETVHIIYKNDIGFLEEILKYMAEEHDFDVCDDVNDLCIKLKLPFLQFENNKWSKNDEDIKEYIKKVTDNVIGKDIAKRIEKIEAGESSNSTENSDSSDTQEQSAEANQEAVQDAISDNKDLLTPIAQAAKVNGPSLATLISKLCKTSKGKARKLDEGVITGLSIMICGALLAVKKNGKGDKKAIAAIAEKINKVVLNNKRGIRDILK